MKIVELCRNREAEVSTSYSVFRVAATDGVTGKCWVVAQVLHATAAVRACAVRPSYPGDAEAGAGRKLLSQDHLSHNLVARNYSGMQWRKLSLHDMKVRSADAARAHSQQNLTRARLRHGRVFYPQRGI
jgi:hypothetical protein